MGDSQHSSTPSSSNMDSTTETTHHHTNGSTAADQPRNPKRRRKNATRACDRCKDKKTKCDGTQPCVRCKSNREACTYEKPYLRGTLPAVKPARSPSPQNSTSPLAPSPDNIASDMAPIQSMTPPAKALREVNVEGGHHDTYMSSSSNLAYSHAAEHQLAQPELLTNGISSGAGRAGWNGTSYDRPDYYLPTAVINRQFWFAEPPFPELNIAAFSLPSKAKALEFVNWYFENASPTYRILHRPTIEDIIEAGLHGCDDEWWGPDLTGVRTKAFEDRSLCAVVFMVWALGCQYPQGVIEQERILALRQRSIQFYQCAKMQLEQETSVVDRLATLQAKLLMTLYLLTTSSVKAAWDLFGVVKNMANALGLNRKRPQHTAHIEPVHLELRRRALWAIYTLDSYMCTIFGACLSWDDNDVTEDYAGQIDDRSTLDNDSSPGSACRDTKTPSLMEAPIAHAKLARVNRMTLRKLYGDSPPTVPGGLPRVCEELGGLIDGWELQLPAFLKAQPYGPPDLYSRQSNVIQLARSHATMMVFRPSLPLSGLVQNTDENGTPLSPATSSMVARHQERCLEAALHAAKLISDLCQEKGLTGAFWFSSYVGFCAATVCYVFVVHHPKDRRRDQILEAAERCVEVERRLSEGDNRMARRYAVALEGLARQVALRIGRPTSRTPSTTTTTTDRDRDIDDRPIAGSGLVTNASTTLAPPPRIQQAPPSPPVVPRQKIPQATLAPNFSQPIPSRLPVEFFPPAGQQYSQPPQMEYMYTPPPGGIMPTMPPAMGMDAGMGEFFVGGLEDGTFQGLDASVSGGHYFGWPGGPAY